jgi:hypothetical protein
MSFDLVNKSAQCCQILIGQSKMLANSYVKLVTSFCYRICLFQGVRAVHDVSV